MRVTILSPHPDDAVLSCWGRLTADAEVTVITVFAGEPPPGVSLGVWDALTGARDASDRWRERLEEDRRALALAGRVPIALPFIDGDYRTGEPDLDALRATIAARRPERIYAPAALLGHPDHIAVRDAALSLRSPEIDVRLYADQPHASVFGWPPWVTGGRPERFVTVEQHWQSHLRRAGIELSSLRPMVRRLDGEWGGKQRAVEMYRTQAPVLRRLSADDDLRYELEWSWR